MGTRRSRHNKGRKAVYKDHRAVCQNLLSSHMYMGGAWLDTRRQWQPTTVFALDVLCEADADVEASADALGRAPSTLCWRAREEGFTLPTQWSRLIAPKRAKKIVSPNRSDLAYPYITNIRPEHADIVAINAMIPRAVPDSMRGDMCQEIMLAIIEGRTTLEKLKAKSQSAQYYIRKFYKDNFEQSGHAMSFSVGVGDGDDERSYDEIASSIAAREWHHDRKVHENDSAYRLATVTMPDQFEAAWRDQVNRTHLSMHDMGCFIGRDEVEKMLEDLSD